MAEGESGKAAESAPGSVFVSEYDVTVADYEDSQGTRRTPRAGRWHLTVRGTTQACPNPRWYAELARGAESGTLTLLAPGPRGHAPDPLVVELWQEVKSDGSCMVFRRVATGMAVGWQDGLARRVRMSTGRPDAASAHVSLTVAHRVRYGLYYGFSFALALRGELGAASDALLEHTAPARWAADLATPPPGTDQTLRTRFAEDELFLGFPALPDARAMRRRYPEGMSGKLAALRPGATQETVNEAPHFRVPSYAQLAWPGFSRRAADASLCHVTDGFVAQMAALAFVLTGIDREDFLRRPFFYPEIFAQVCSIYPHARPYAADADLEGSPIDDFNDLACSPEDHACAGDCEDSAITTARIAQALHLRGRFGTSKLLPRLDDPVVAAVERLAACYAPFLVDTAVGADSRATSAAVAVDAGARRRMLHMRCMLVPLPAVRTMLDTGLHAVGGAGADENEDVDGLFAAHGVGTPRTRAAQRARELVARLDQLAADLVAAGTATHEDIRRVSVLEIESTDGCLGDATERDDLAPRVSVALRGCDDYRCTVPFHMIRDTSGPTVWLRACVPMLGEEGGAVELVFLQRTGPEAGAWTAGIDVPTGTANVTKFMIEACGALPICPAPPEERELVRVHHSLRRVPAPLEAPPPERCALPKGRVRKGKGGAQTTAVLCLSAAEDMVRALEKDAAARRGRTWTVQTERVWLTPRLETTVAFVTESE